MMADPIINTVEMENELPSRRERHQSSKRKRKPERTSRVIQESSSSSSEGGEGGPERSKIFKKERERQGSLFVASSIFWLYILLVGFLLFFTIRHYS